MLFKEDTVARADAMAIRKGVGFYRWTHDLVEVTGKDALEVLQKIYISDISKVAVGRCAQTIYGYTVEKNIGFATVRADVPRSEEHTSELQSQR